MLNIVDMFVSQRVQTRQWFTEHYNIFDERAQQSHVLILHQK